MKTTQDDLLKLMGLHIGDEVRTEYGDELIVQEEKLDDFIAAMYGAPTEYVLAYKDGSIKRSLGSLFNMTYTVVKPAVPINKEPTVFTTWHITGYAGYNDCDGPSDYNIDSYIYTDTSVTKEEVAAILNTRYKNKRVTCFNIKKEEK